MLNAKADDYVRMCASSGLRMWAGTKDCLTGKRPITDKDRSYLMRSSTLAGMSIAQSGTTVPHALSYNLTYDLAIAHGRAVGYFLPADGDRGRVEAALFVRSMSARARNTARATAAARAFLMEGRDE